MLADCIQQIGLARSNRLLDLRVYDSHGCRAIFPSPARRIREEFMYRRVPSRLLSTALVAALLTGVVLAAPASAASGAVQSGSFALSGQAAREFRLPADVVAVRSWSDARGNTATRYQQVVAGASVLGGQITLTRDAAG